MVIFGINFPQKGYIPLINFYKILPGEGVPGLHSHAKFDHSSLKTGLTVPKIAQNGNFGTNLPLGENLGGQ